MVCFIVNGMWVVILGMNLTCVCVCVYVLCAYARLRGYIIGCSFSFCVLG